MKKFKLIISIVVVIGVLSSFFIITINASSKNEAISKVDETKLSGEQLNFGDNSCNNEKPRVIVTTDIGGTDFDDFQSLVHLLVYADEVDIEGIISSPFGGGRKEDILGVIDTYETDYPNLKTYSKHYPTPQKLRKITKQGETECAPYLGYRKATSGSKLIVKSARKKDSRPLHILVWGGIEDVAQALHDAPDIASNIYIYYIGGPNKKWSPNGYNYIEQNHRNVNMIEANSTYRGWFVGGNQTGDYSNINYLPKYIDDHGALGELFMTFGKEVKSLKMGDTPSVARLLKGSPGNPLNPEEPSWGGQFVKAWERPYKMFNRLTTSEDTIEAFGIMELSLPVGSTKNPVGVMKVENQELEGYAASDGTLRFRFCPKTAKEFEYTIVDSNVTSLNNKTGSILATVPPEESKNNPSSLYKNWWTDDPSPELVNEGHQGVVTINQWRNDFLDDFASRMDRCKEPKKN